VPPATNAIRDVAGGAVDEAGDDGALVVELGDDVVRVAVQPRAVEGRVDELADAAAAGVDDVLDEGRVRELDRPEVRLPLSS
jgi:hypothetical protein